MYFNDNESEKDEYPKLYQLEFSDPSEWLESMTAVNEGFEAELDGNDIYRHKITALIGPRGKFILEIRIYRK